MLLSRINNEVPVDRLRAHMDRVFHDFFGNGPNLEPFGARVFPAVNLWEDDQAVFVEAELPGIKLEDLELTMENNELTIKGQRLVEHKDESPVYRRRERGQGAFARTMRLPVDIDAENVSANLRDGVLTVTLPKAEAVRPRKIEIQAQAQ
jgi:HSP20 family protein